MVIYNISVIISCICNLFCAIETVPIIISNNINTYLKNLRIYIYTVLCNIILLHNIFKLNKVH
jgi:hypothetical protein